MGDTDATLVFLEMKRNCVPLHQVLIDERPKKVFQQVGFVVPPS
jgi:hypothetical protein